MKSTDFLNDTPKNLAMIQGIIRSYVYNEKPVKFNISDKLMQSIIGTKLEGHVGENLSKHIL